jgi:hypothetical protein
MCDASKVGAARPSIYKWKAKYGGMDVSKTRRLKALEDEKAKLKRLLAEAMLNAMLRDMAARKWSRPPGARLIAGLASILLWRRGWLATL